MRKILFAFLLLTTGESFAQTESIVGLGWAGNTINTVVFRRNSVVSDKQWQYVAYYDTTGHVVLAKRKTGTDTWEVKQTPYKGNIKHSNVHVNQNLDSAK